MNRHHPPFAVALLLTAVAWSSSSEAWIPPGGGDVIVQQQQRRSLQQQQHQQRLRLFSIHPLTTLDDGRGEGGGFVGGWNHRNNNNNNNEEWYKNDDGYHPNQQEHRDRQEQFYYEQQQMQQQLHGGYPNENGDGERYYPHEEHDGYNSNGILNQEGGNSWYHNTNNVEEVGSQMSMNEEYNDYGQQQQQLLYDQDGYYFGDESQSYQNNGGYENQEDLYENNHDDFHRHPQGDQYSMQEIAQNDEYLEQQQQLQEQEQPPGSQEDFNSPYAMERNDQYNDEEERRRQEQEERHFQEDYQRRPSEWDMMRMEEEEEKRERRFFRPPQQAARNRGRSSGPRSSLFMSSFLDDFFWGGDSFFDSPFDRMFSSSPFGLFSPFPRQRRGRRRSPFWRRSPIDAMMEDLMSPPFRTVSPFTRFDRSIDDRFQSMMRNGALDNRGAMVMMNNDPMLNRRLLEQAERLLNTDVAVTTPLGSPVQMGPIISQTSSSVSYMINGRRSQQQQIQLQVSVRGSRGGGVVRLAATHNDGIQRLILSLADERGEAREVNVRLSDGRPSTGSNTSPTGTFSSPPDIVDAEIVDRDSGRETRPVPRDYWAATV